MKIVLDQIIELLIDKLVAYQPHQMAEIIDYGKVKGYSQDYDDFRAAIFKLVEMLRDHYSIDYHPHITSLEALRPYRMMDEKFFKRETRDLKHILIAIRRHIAEVPDPVFNRWPNEPSTPPVEALKSIFYLADIEPPGLKQPTEKTVQTDMPIFISTEFGSSLVPSLVECVNATKGTPLIGLSQSTQNEAQRHQLALEQLRKCGGALFSFTDERGSDKTITLERFFVERVGVNLFLEIGHAIATFDQRVLVVVERLIIDLLPPQFHDVPLFVIERNEMDSAEIGKLIGILKQESWYSSDYDNVFTFPNTTKTNS